MPNALTALAFSILSCVLLATVALRAGEPQREAKPVETAAPAKPAKALPQFTILDVNGDSTISSDEARAHVGLDAIFAECDADKNGALNTWEFAEARSKLEE